MLELVGYRVEVAGSCREALVRVAYCHYGLILVDYLLPDGDGLDLIAQMRRRPDLATLPIIMCTSSTDEETLRLAFEAGASDFVSKPVRPTELKTRVHNAIQLYESSLNMLADQATRSLEGITALVAHEINNPLAAVMHFTREMMAALAEDVQATKNLARMLKGLERIQALVADLRMATLSQEQPIQSMPLKEVVRLACRLLTLRNSGSIWIADDVDGEVLIWVHPGVAAQALAALANYLLDAAHRYGRGGIHLTCAVRPRGLELVVRLCLESYFGAPKEEISPFDGDRLGPETPPLVAACRQLAAYGVEVEICRDALPLPALKLHFPPADRYGEVIQREEVQAR